MDDQVRQELKGLLDTGWAHEGPLLILADFPMDRANEVAPGLPYSPWQLLEHIRFCQQEVLEQIEAEVMPSYNWKVDFWRKDSATPEMWQESVNRFFADNARLQELALTAELHAPCRNRADVSILHAILNVAAHNHYHLGEFSALRSVMGTWPPRRVDTMGS